MPNYGYVRVAAAVPKVEVGDPDRNLLEMLRIAADAAEQGVQLLVFPELCITGYTCGDLFRQTILLDAAEAALLAYAEGTADDRLISVVGLPLHLDGQRFNVAAVVNGGKILAIVPKQYIPNYREFYELRWFSHGDQTRRREVTIGGEKIPFGNDILVEAAGVEHFRMALEICEDLWGPIPPSSHHALAGARIIVNPSASNAVVAKADYRRALVTNQSARCIAAYVYASCGVTESSSDLVFDGHAIIAENGVQLEESKRYERASQLIVADVDLERIVTERMDSSFGQAVSREKTAYRTVLAEAVDELDVSDTFRRTVAPRPFVPSDPATCDERCEEVFAIQVSGLSRRLEHLERAVGKREVTIGISGGLDSTLALLVTAMAFDKLGWDRKGIIAFTLPGFGTTERTRGNAERLCDELGVTFREVSIVEMTLAYLRSVGHLGPDEPPHADCLHCQNSQARLRTNLLMNHGFMVGTGDLSEIALGWSTYGGDQTSMYGVNAGVPKTLVKYVVAWVAEKNLLFGEDVSKILRDVVATPVSPELNPGTDGNGDSAQRTEDILGPYAMHDFILHAMVRYGCSPEKILFLAEQAFAGVADRAAILKTMRTFYRRFFAAQFKRNASPDGPKVGSVSLSQRGDWRMPSDILGRLWQEEVEALDA